jgi:beta-xylosidase
MNPEWKGYIYGVSNGKGKMMRKSGKSLLLPITLSFCIFISSMIHADYMYFGNGGDSIGVAKSGSPTGPFANARGRALITRSMPNCNVQWCFDPSVFLDSDGQTYLYFGGGGPGNARVIKLGGDMISTVGSAITIDAPRFFEASWMHKYHDKYYLSIV